MSFSGMIHKLAWNVLDWLWRYLNRKRIHDGTLSLFSNDCTGGVILHNCGMRFNTPTINLFFDDVREYVCFLEHLHIYRELPLEQVFMENIDYPIGVIKNSDYGDVHIHFMHYVSFDEAIKSWQTRCERIQLDNSFALLHLSRWEADSLHVLKRFAALPFKGKCLISWPGVLPENLVWKDSLFIHPAGLEYRHGKLLEWKNHFRKRYIDDFDYISFLNGKTVTITPDNK